MPRLLRAWAGLLALMLALMVPMWAQSQMLPTPDEMPPAVEPRSDVYASSVTSFEGAWTHTLQRFGLSDIDLLNLAVEHRATWSKGVSSIILNGRLDYDDSIRDSHSDGELSLNLRELYVHLDPIENVSLDLGRFTIRDGMAQGFSPTDVFRRGSIIQARTEDPVRLREARLGCVGARVHWMGDAGNLALTFAPEIGDNAAPAWYDPLAGATNGVDHWHLAYAPPTFGELSTNFVLSHRSDERLAGLNLSTSIGRTLVAYSEAAYVRRQQPLGGAAFTDARWRPQAAVGASYTTSVNLTLTFEGQWNGFGASSESAGSIAVLQESFQRQEPAGRLTWMMLGQWARFPLYYSDLTVLLRVNHQDESWSAWSEWRYNWQKISYAISVTVNHGDERSLFGAMPTEVSLLSRFEFFF